MKQQYTFKGKASSKPKPAVGVMANSIHGFQCTMGACEDNCCRNTTWRITVDEATYKKYDAMDNELGEHIRECIEQGKDGTYFFKEFDHGHCPLLTEEGLCYIHKNLGPEFLCTTCTTYPRVWGFFNGKHEHWLSLSCPDAIRHVLYRKKKISFIESPITALSKPEPPKPLEGEKNRIRDFLLDILQFKKFSIKDKLVFMGLFMRSLSKLPKDAGFGKAVTDAIKLYRSNMMTSGLLEDLQAGLGTIHPDNRKFFFKTLAAFAAAAATPPKVIPEGIANTEYYHLMAEFQQDVKAETTDYYIEEAFDKLIVPYVNANKYVFENYLAYMLMSSRFLCETDDFAKAYAWYAGEFLAMLVFTAGLFNANEAISHDEMIIGMYMYHRKISHAASLRKKLADAYTNNMLTLMLGALGGVK